MRNAFITGTIGRGGALLLPGTAGALLLTLLSVQPAEAQFAMYPIVLTMTPAVGSEEVATVWVRNEGTRPREFRFDVQDFEQDSEGTPRFMPSGAHPNSCGARLEVYPRAATIPPGSSQELRVRLAGEESVCWAALFAEVEADETGGIVARQQIGVRVNGIPPGFPLEGEIENLEVDGRGSPTLHIRFRNGGRAPLRPAGQVEVRDAQDRVVATQEVRAFSVLPGVTRRVSVVLERRLPAGRYTVVTVLDFGGEYLAGGQTVLVVR
jgi:hypothetical protein